MSGIYLNATSTLVSNPYASFGSTQAVANQIMSDPSFVDINAFLNYPDPSGNTTGWYTAYNVLERILLSNASNGISYNANGFKFLLALDDGTVIIDTSKDIRYSASNTYTLSSASGPFAAATYPLNSPAAYSKKAVNENHTSRPEVLNAVLSASGVGSARRFSSSSQSAFQYYAVRLGNSPQSNLGTLRVAVAEYLKTTDVAGATGSSTVSGVDGNGTSVNIYNL